MQSYERSLATERRIYRDCLEVHRLPGIFHYWSETHLQPALSRFGFDDTTEFFFQSLNVRDPRRFVSLGSGNCDLEIELAKRLRASRGTDFIVECVDLNEAMLERGRAAAAEAGLAEQFAFVQADLNQWAAAHEYDAAIANQSLHHVVNLEGLFDEIRRCLTPRGVLITADMIGRNGHQRWPEALGIVQEFWRRLPPSYRCNRKLGAYEERFLDWDCSMEGFEGVRSQDILPLLADRFHFQLFFPFGNVIDPFIDRAFGENFDAAAAWDRSFIDEVHARDEREIGSGNLKPTHMLAVLGTVPHAAARFPGRLSPEFCIRTPGVNLPAQREPGEDKAYDWSGFPHSVQSELEIACSRLGETGEEIRARTKWALDLERQWQARTAWALALDQDLQLWKHRAAELEREFSERTDWVLAVDRELKETQANASHREHKFKDLEDQFAKRTAWALKLSDELAWIQGEHQRLLNHPLLRLARLASGYLRRVRSLFSERAVETAATSRRDGSPESAGQ